MKNIKKPHQLLPKPSVIWAKYIELGNLKATGKNWGVSADCVHGRLRKAGYKMNGALWDDAEKQRVSDYYSNTPPETFNLVEFSKQMNRPHTSICLQAQRMGLTTYTRPHRQDTKERQSRGVIERWKKNAHPRGFLGYKHTDSAKAIISMRGKKRWATDKAFGIGQMSEESRQRRSDIMAGHVGRSNNYSRCKGGRRDDIGPMYLRSSWEANYARYLNLLLKLKAIESWEYEAETFWFHAIKRGVRTYKPDFKVQRVGEDTPVFIEVKGWMDAKSKTKLKRMKKYYPHIRLEVVGKKEYLEIERKFKSEIPLWEEPSKVK